MQKSKKKLGEMLLEENLIDDFQLKAALAYQKEWGGRLGSILIRKGYVSEQDMISVMEKQLGIACISLADMERPPDEVLKMVRADIASKFEFFPVRFDGRALLIATSDPTDLKTLDDISFSIGVRVKPLLALESDILKAIALHYEGITGPAKMTGIDKEKLARKISRTMPSEFIVEHAPQGLRDSRTETKGASAPEEASQKAVIESIIELLIAKGIFTKEELLNRIRSKRES